MNNENLTAAQVSAEHIAAPAAMPIVTPEMADHARLIIDRPRRMDRAMMAYAGFGVSPGVRSLVATPPIAELGTFTYFSLRRGWTNAADGNRTVVTIIFAGYKARLKDGKIVLGGAGQNVCAYDLRFRPFDGALSGGKILNSRKRTTVRLGLILDEAVEKVAKGVAHPVQDLVLPQFWAGFAPDAVPEAENCAGTRRAVLSAVRPGYTGPVLPALRCPSEAPIAEVVRDPDGDWIVGFGTARSMPVAVVNLPRTAVLRPYTRVGMTVPVGTALADFIPRREYPNIGKIAEIYGSDITDWLMQDVVAAHDEMLGGLQCRRAALCPSSLNGATRIFEDVRHLLNDEGVVRAQVVRVSGGLSPLCPSRNEAVVADLAALRAEWAHKFQPRT